eukprot:762448-Hanusia_phi.AAC.2
MMNSIQKGDKIRFMNTGKSFIAEEIGVLAPTQQPTDTLEGEIPWPPFSRRSCSIPCPLLPYSRSVPHPFPGYRALLCSALIFH